MVVLLLHLHCCCIKSKNQSVHRGFDDTCNMLTCQINDESQDVLRNINALI